MGEEAAILAAVAANPADDLPRLAYADWLDDHAGDLPDPEAARVRAEFIRVQCEIKRLEHLSSAELQRYADLYRRQEAIQTDHRRDLLGPLADAVGPHDAVFDRGFLKEVTVGAAAYLTHGDFVAALRPLPDVRVVGAVHVMTDFVQLQDAMLRAVSRLEIQADWYDASSYDLRPEGVAAVAGCPELTRLRELSFEGSRIGDAGVAALAASPYLPALKDLDLSGNQVTDEGVRAVVGSWLWTRLDRLVLGGNPLTDEAAAALADAAVGCRLANLNLRFLGGMSNSAKNLLVGVYAGRTKLDIF